MARLLRRCLDAARSLASRLPAAGYVVHVPPSLDIVTYFPARPSTSAISAATERVFAEGERGSSPLYLAKLVVDAESFARLHPEITVDSGSVTILRSCLMRPEQAEWAPAIAKRLEELAAQ
jgi:hypothetical protein